MCHVQVLDAVTVRKADVGVVEVEWVTPLPDYLTECIHQLVLDSQLPRSFVGKLTI